MLRKKQTNHVEDLVVAGISVWSAEVFGHWERLKVRIAAACIDYTLDDTTGQKVEGSKHASRSFVEFWTFVRETKDGAHAAWCADRITQEGEVG